MTATINNQVQKGLMAIDIVGEAAIGLQGNIANPEGVDLLITEAFLHIKTGATAAATFNIGIGVSGADNSNLMSAFDVNAPGDNTCWNVVARVASEAAMTTPALWLSTLFLTLTSAAASAEGLTATLYVKYIRLD